MGLDCDVHEHAALATTTKINPVAMKRTRERVYARAAGIVKGNNGACGRSSCTRVRSTGWTRATVPGRWSCEDSIWLVEGERS